MASNQQKAVFVMEIGKPVELGTRPIPSPAKGEILVKVAAAMLLPHDAYGRNWGLFIESKLPYVLGSNIAGTVLAVGRNVTAFQPGDEVFGLSSFDASTPDQAGLQEHAILSASAVAKRPAGFSHDQVVTLPVNLVTAWLALFGPSGLGLQAPALPSSKEAAVFNYEEETLVILGAGAGNAHFAIQLAALAGIGMIIAVAGLGGKEDLLAMGATHVLDRHRPAEELVEEVHSIVGGENGVEHVYQAHGQDYALAVALLSKDKPSFLQSVHPISEDVTAARPLCKAAMIECSNEGLGAYAERFWKEIPKWLVEGKIRPATVERVVAGLEKVDEINVILDAMEQGMGRGAVVHP